jgi:hypothetical protein
MDTPIHSVNDNCWGTPEKEMDIAYRVLHNFAQRGVETSGWRDYSVSNLIEFDDTDGSGLHPNQPGVCANIRATAPSGKVYFGQFTLNEDVHGINGQRLFSGDDLDLYTLDDQFNK